MVLPDLVLLLNVQHSSLLHRLDQIIRFRCQKNENQAGQSNYRSFPSVTEVFELLLNKHETCDMDLSRGAKEIELKKPFVQVNICDYDENRKNEAITVITNPSFVNVT